MDCGFGISDLKLGTIIASILSNQQYQSQTRNCIRITLTLKPFPVFE